MANLGDCRCIPRKDKEDLTTAIDHAKKFYDISIQSGEKDIERGRIPYGYWESKDRLRDVRKFEETINGTPYCADGDISRECTRISDLEMTQMDHTLDPAIMRLGKIGDKDTISRLENFRRKIRRINLEKMR